MNCRFNFRFTAPLRRAIVCALLLSFARAFAQDYPTEINYQGQLYDQGMPVTGVYDMTFQAWDSQAGGMPISVPISANDVQVLGGQFFVPLDFGADLFGFAPIYVEITAAPNGDPGAVVTFAPRQKIAPVPMAINSDRVDAQDADALATATQVSTVRRKAFQFVLVNPLGQPTVTLQSISLTPPDSGYVLLRGRGFCNLAPVQGSSNIVLTTIGTQPATAFSETEVSEWGIASLVPDAPMGTHQISWTTERLVWVVVGNPYAFVLAAKHESGNTTSDCSGSLTAEFYQAELDD